MGRTVVVFPLEKGWVKEHYRSDKRGNPYKVSGYWRDDHRSIVISTWKDLALPKWGEVMARHKNGSLFDPIRNAEELQSFLSSLKNVFRINKDGWTMLPTADHGMYAGVEPDFYRHLVRNHGQAEAARRISYFRAVVDTLMHPWEIWRQPVGAGQEDGRIFLAGYRDIEDQSKTVSVLVGFRDNKPLLWTVIPISKIKKVERLRYGELLFKDYEHFSDER